MKQIKRKYFETYGKHEEAKEGIFICTGQWADGHYAYSRLDQDGNRIEEDDGMFVQLCGYVDGKNRRYMQRI